MRLDYPLYILAIILYAAAVASFFMISDETIRTIYMASAVGAGLLFAVAGYMIRPKTKTMPIISALTAIDQHANQEQPTAQQVTKIETSEEEHKIDQTSSSFEFPIEDKAKASIQIRENSESDIQAPPQTNTPASELSENSAVASEQMLSTPSLELTQIRGINATRAEQLKANGIKNIQDLANASAEDLAKSLNVSPKIIKMWIGSARKLSK